jgi:hypothetical protein
MPTASVRRRIRTVAWTALLCAACANPPTATQQVTHDGLQLVPHSSMERAWVKPGEDFSQYTHVGLLHCFVAFKKDWRMNHPDVGNYDIERIKKTLSEEFNKVFVQELDKGGYPIATTPAENVLLVRPAIIDLEITAPDTMDDVSSMTFTASAGSMALYVEFYDSVSNEILARAVDRRQANHIGDIEETTYGSNMYDARRLLKHWADLLVEKLDEFHVKKAP